MTEDLFYLCDDFHIGGDSLFEAPTYSEFHIVIRTGDQIRNAQKRLSQCVGRYMRRCGSPAFKSPY